MSPSTAMIVLFCIMKYLQFKKWIFFAFSATKTSKRNGRQTLSIINLRECNLISRPLWPLSSYYKTVGTRLTTVVRSTINNDTTNERSKCHLRNFPFHVKLCVLFSEFLNNSRVNWLMAVFILVCNSVQQAIILNSTLSPR